MTTTRRFLAIALASLIGASAYLACSSSSNMTTDPQPDLGNVARDMRSAVTPDGGNTIDMAQPASCPTIAAYCADTSNPCVTAWPDANDPAAWCSGTRTFDILPEASPCPSGDHLVVLSNSTAFGNKSFIYRGTVLIGIIGFPDDTSTGICLAGDPTLGQADIANCPPNNTVAVCNNGTIQ